MKPHKLVLFLAIAIVASLAGIESALAADCNTNGCYINGTITRSDTGGALNGATVTNSSNATQTDTTDSNGVFNISGFVNTTATNRHNFTIEAEGFTAGTLINITVSGADNTTSTAQLVIITPSNSGLTASSVTKNSATLSWTVSATDSVNNNYVGNRITYYASGVPTVTSEWSNTTTAPSFPLSNLRENHVYTYTVETYNRANESYSDSDSSTFTTTYVGGIKKKTPVPTAIKPKATVAKKSVTKMVTPSNRNQVAFLIIVIIIGAAYFLTKKK